MVTAATRVAGVIGDPIRHSLSPVLHNAAFAELGLDWVYVAFPVPRGRAGEALRAMSVLGIDGLNVTMPHKGAAAEACDELSTPAKLLGSVNTVVRRDDGVLFGDSTDGPGLLASLVDEGVDVAGRQVLVLGAGGAARAVAVALAGAGGEITVAARNPEAADEVAALARGRGASFDALDETLRSVDMVVNATPLGMAGEHPPFDSRAIESRHVVVDLVYQPSVTPLLAEAAHRGARAIGGLGMLVHQAALAFEAWTGVEAPLRAMRSAAEAALGARTPS